MFPYNDEVMIDIDGYRKDDSGGCGAIIKDHLGTTLSAACGGSVPSTIVNHELKGV